MIFEGESGSSSLFETSWRPSTLLRSGEEENEQKELGQDVPELEVGHVGL